jgi:hypothetical protein
MEMMPLEKPGTHSPTSLVDGASQRPAITANQYIKLHPASSAPSTSSTPIAERSSAAMPNTPQNTEDLHYRGESYRNATSTTLLNVDMGSKGQDALAFSPLSVSSATIAKGSSSSAQNNHQVTEDLQSDPMALENGATLPPANCSPVATSQIIIQNHADTERNSRPLNLRRRFALNVQQQCPSLICWVLMLLFAIFLCYYFYEILIVVDPQVGKLNPKPGNTNFIVAVLSQVFGGLMISLYLEILNLLHLQLLSRPRGALMLEAEQLANSTGALGTARMLFTSGRHHVWTLLRYVTSKYEITNLLANIVANAE